MNDFIKKLETPLYLLAVILIVSPALELAGTGWPIQFRNAEWRFGVFGLLSQALLTPILGTTIILVTAEVNERRRAKLLVSLVNAMVALIVLLALPIFALDSLELRGRFTAGSQDQVAAVEAAKRNLDIAVGKALVVHSLVIVYLGLMARAGFNSWRLQLGEDKRKASEPHPLSLARIGAAEGTAGHQRQAAPATPRPPAPAQAQPQAPEPDHGLEPIEPQQDLPTPDTGVDEEEDDGFPKLDLD